MKPVVFLCGILRVKMTKFKHIRKIVIVANMETIWAVAQRTCRKC